MTYEFKWDIEIRSWHVDFVLKSTADDSNCYSLCCNEGILPRIFCVLSAARYSAILPVLAMDFRKLLLYTWKKSVIEAERATHGTQYILWYPGKEPGGDSFGCVDGI